MLLNAEVIEEVRETLGDAALRNFLSRMLAEVEATGTQLHSLMTAQDFDTLAGTAHRAAGSAASVGAVGLHAALKDIENAARGPQGASSLPDLIAGLSARILQTRAALSALVGPI